MRKFEKMLDRLREKRARLEAEIEALELLEQTWQTIGPYGVADQKELDALRLKLQGLFEFDDSE